MQQVIQYVWVGQQLLLWLVPPMIIHKHVGGGLPKYTKHTSEGIPTCYGHYSIVGQHSTCHLEHSFLHLCTTIPHLSSYLLLYLQLHIQIPLIGCFITGHCSPTCFRKLDDSLEFKWRYLLTKIKLPMPLNQCCHHSLLALVSHSFPLAPHSDALTPHPGLTPLNPQSQLRCYRAPHLCVTAKYTSVYF